LDKLNLISAKRQKGDIMKVYIRKKDGNGNIYSVHYDTVVATNGGEILVKFKRDGWEHGAKIETLEVKQGTKPRALRRGINNALRALAKTSR
jgi:hypothetical protein